MVWTKGGAAAARLGVSIRTLRLWDATGKIKTLRTLGGTRPLRCQRLPRHYQRRVAFRGLRHTTRRCLRRCRPRARTRRPRQHDEAVGPPTVGQRHRLPERRCALHSATSEPSRRQAALRKPSGARTSSCRARVAKTSVVGSVQPTAKRAPPTPKIGRASCRERV